MDINMLIQTLHPLERKAVPVLKKCGTLRELMAESGLCEAEAMRVLQWLENKGALKIESEIKETIKLDSNGISYLKNGLPERRFLAALVDGPLAIKDMTGVSGLSPQEVTVCMGMLRGKAAITIDKGQLVITNHGNNILDKEWLEEAFLKKVSAGGIAPSDLAPEEKFAFDVFAKRKDIVKTDIEKIKRFTLTDLGKKLASTTIDESSFVDRVTPEMLKDGSWKGKNFRRYDVKINVPKVFPGRKQHYRKFLDSVRQKFMALGFTEMKGPIVESAFWDMDALFMPQFHSARDIHDAYYVKEPKYAKLDESIVEQVRQAHENGYGTGSKGWQYKFDMKKTHEHLLRTQGTACSARMLASKDLKIPGKYFGITKCFRYDVIDASHLPDFFQTEGIVLAEGLNFTHLKGLLKMFAEQFAQTTEFKIRPAYFPFTEPSAELFAKHPELGWIELGGSGIFRPELTKALGIDVPVIAWGLGIDRIGMVNMGINDIRDLYSPDLSLLKKMPFKF